MRAGRRRDGSSPLAWGQRGHCPALAPSRRRKSARRPETKPPRAGVRCVCSTGREERRAGHDRQPWGTVLLPTRGGAPRSPRRGGGDGIEYRRSGRYSRKAWRDSNPQLHVGRPASPGRRSTGTLSRTASIPRTHAAPLRRAARLAPAPPPISSRPASLGGLCVFCSTRPQQHVRRDGLPEPAAHGDQSRPVIRWDAAALFPLARRYRRAV